MLVRSYQGLNVEPLKDKRFGRSVLRHDGEGSKGLSKYHRMRRVSNQCLHLSPYHQVFSPELVRRSWNAGQDGV